MLFLLKITFLVMVGSFCQATYRNKLSRMEAQLENAYRHRYKDMEKRFKSEECDGPLEIAFVLDESGSIWGEDFKTQLTFIDEVVDMFKIGPDDTHIALMTFADDAKVHMNLGEYVTNRTAMMVTMKNISQTRGNTHTDKALRTLRVQIFNPKYVRPRITKIGILITDGGSENTTRTVRQAELAKEAGITLFTIGVGRKINKEELRMVASDPAYAFDVGSYDELSVKLMDVLAETACEAVSTRVPKTTTTTTTTTTTPAPVKPPQSLEGCDGSTALDVIFAVPDEAGIRDTEFTLDFIKEVISGLNISTSQIQVGLTPRLCSDLEGVPLHKNDQKETLQDDISDRQLNSTQLSRQLEYLLDAGFSSGNGQRTTAKDVAILIVDNAIADVQKVNNLAVEAKKRDITLITIGVGEYVNNDELMEIASDPDYSYHVYSYEDLLRLAKEIQKSLCTAYRPPPVIEGCAGRTPADILFSIPDEANIADTNTTLSFLESLTMDLHISQTQIQVGLTPRLCADLDEIRLAENDNKETLIAAIGRRLLGSTLLYRQLEYAINTGFSIGDEARIEARKILVLIVDNKSSDRDRVYRYGEEAKSRGAALITVGVGPYAESGELQALATSGRHSFYVESYEELFGIRQDVLDALCLSVTN